MLIQKIGNGSVSVYMAPDDLKLMQIEPDGMTDCDMLRVLKQVFQSMGQKMAGNVQLEIYPGRNDMLLFIRQSRMRPLFFSFSSFEDLLSAVSYSEVLPSSLYYIDGIYILSVTPWDGDCVDSAFFEFGEKLDIEPDYMLHVTEHGKTIIGCDAINTLRSSFLQDRLSKAVT